MATDDNDGVIVRSTIDLGRNLGLTVVAEGVENAETWVRLVEFGCELGQGYYFGRPMADDAFQALVRRDEGFAQRRPRAAAPALRVVRPAG